MPDIVQNLEHRYRAFLENGLPWHFFMGLADYVRYILATPGLKKVVNREFEKRDTEYKKVRDAEKQTIAELQKAKQKLLKIIEDKEIRVEAFSQDMSFIPSNWNDETILGRMRMFENGQISMSGFFSDNLQRFLFDIAANILKLGYKDDLKEFIVTDREYGQYCTRINGPNVGLAFGGNTRGNFIFSKTWPKRFELVKAEATAREIEPWGAFEALIIFWKARAEASKNANMNEVIKDCINDKEYRLDGKEAVDVVFAVQDWNTLMREHTLVTDQEMRYLKAHIFKTRVATAHSYLIENLAIDTNTKKPVNGKAMKLAMDMKLDKLWHQNVDGFMADVKIFMEEYRLEKQEQQNIRQGAIGGKWWKNGERPQYDQKNKVISLSEKTCQIPLTAINRIVLCDAVFSKQIGEWVEENDVILKFRDTEGNSRSFYDAVRGTNENIEKDLGIVGMLEYKASKARVKKELFETKK